MEINGIKYERIPQKPKETSRKSVLMAPMAMFEYTN